MEKHGQCLLLDYYIYIYIDIDIDILVTYVCTFQKVAILSLKV